MKDGVQRKTGKSALEMNIFLGKSIARAVRSTLGPKGMDKMIVDDIGDMIISNDGATILREMQMEHPVGKMMVDVAVTQEAEVGDGTTTAVVVAGALLEEAGKLVVLGIHPSTIIKGYRAASEKAKEAYTDLGFEYDSQDLLNVALTSMTGKVGGEVKHLADLVIEASTSVSGPEDISIVKKPGACLNDTRLVDGVIIDKGIVNTGMKKKVKDACIALLNGDIKHKSLDGVNIDVSSPVQLQSFMDQEEKTIKELVGFLVKNKVTVVFCTGEIDDLAQSLMVKEGIVGVRRVRPAELSALEKACSASAVTSLKQLNAKCLGECKLVEERKISGDDMVFVEGCVNPKSLTILVRGGTDQVIDEVERALHDAIGSVNCVLKSKRIVVGAGACEMSVAIVLKRFAGKVGGREQLAIEAFADALEVIPRTLAETAGMDPIDALVEHRAAFSSVQNGHNFDVSCLPGIDVLAGKVGMIKSVVEPLGVKIQALNSASEIVEVILRIDDIILGAPAKVVPSPVQQNRGP